MMLVYIESCGTRYGDPVVFDLYIVTYFSSPFIKDKGERVFCRSETLCLSFVMATIEPYPRID